MYSGVRLLVRSLDPPYVGIFLEGFLTNGDWRTIIVCAIQLIASVAIYWPFFKIMERNDEIEAMEKAQKAVFTQEEAKLLEDLDLDF